MRMSELCFTTEPSMVHSLSECSCLCRVRGLLRSWPGTIIGTPKPSPEHLQRSIRMVSCARSDRSSQPEGIFCQHPRMTTIPCHPCFITNIIQMCMYNISFRRKHHPSRSKSCRFDVILELCSTRLGSHRLIWG